MYKIKIPALILAVLTVISAVASCDFISTVETTDVSVTDTEETRQQITSPRR